MPLTMTCDNIEEYCYSVQWLTTGWTAVVRYPTCLYATTSRLVSGPTQLSMHWVQLNISAVEGRKM